MGETVTGVSRFVAGFSGSPSSPRGRCRSGRSCPARFGLIGVTELVGENPEAGSQNLGTALVAIPAAALGTPLGTMIVRAVGIAMRMRIVKGSRARHARERGRLAAMDAQCCVHTPETPARTIDALRA
jgi:hypothetical protein